MEHLLSNCITEWIEKELPEMKFPAPATSHIDSILKQDIRPQDFVSVACDAYLELVKQTLSISWNYTASLIIPLNCTEELDTEGPIQDTLDQHLDTNEPPSLYIIDREVFKYHEDQERYSRPLRFNIIDSAVENIYSTYVTFRNVVDMGNGGEYIRFIQLSYFPSDYVLFS